MPSASAVSRQPDAAGGRRVRTMSPARARRPCIALGTRQRYTAPVAARLHRVDREDLIAGRDQRRGPTDRGQFRCRPAPARRPHPGSEPSRRARAPGDPGHPSGNRAAQRDGRVRPAPPHRDDLQPVVADEQHHRISALRRHDQQPAGDSSDLMDSAHANVRRARHPISGSITRPQAGARSDPRTQQRSRGRECSPAAATWHRVCRRALASGRSFGTGYRCRAGRAA